jgi:hypothetical protein
MTCRLVAVSANSSKKQRPKGEFIYAGVSARAYVCSSDLFRCGYLPDLLCVGLYKG